MFSGLFSISRQNGTTTSCSEQLMWKPIFSVSIHQTCVCRLRYVSRLDIKQHNDLKCFDCLQNILGCHIVRLGVDIHTHPFLFSLNIMDAYNPNSCLLKNKLSNFWRHSGEGISVYVDYKRYAAGLLDDPMCPIPHLVLFEDEVQIQEVGGCRNMCCWSRSGCFLRCSFCR